MIDICAFSDGHGILPTINDPFDLMLIGGDNVDLYKQCSKSLTADWYIKIFCKWVNKLPFKDEQSKIVIIAGNHEVGLSYYNEFELCDLWNRIAKLTNNRIVYLQNTSYKFVKDSKSLLIFGTPYCKIFGTWAYMRSQDELKELYSQIPDNCDILLSHDAPYGISDMCFDWVNQGRNLEHIGNKALRDAILEKSPKICIHGHLHSSDHSCETLGSTKVFCVSLVNEDYRETYEPLYLKV